MTKWLRYITEEEHFAWDLEFLSSLQHEFNISVTLGSRQELPEVSEELARLNLTDLGPQEKMEFIQNVANSFVLIGVNYPHISPSPWDGLCQGVPVGH